MSTFAIFARPAALNYTRNLVHNAGDSFSL
jgi:hypothetical protein